MSEVGFEIQDCTTGTAEYTEADATSVTYITGLVDPIAQVDLNWTSLALTDGCKCLCVFDAALEDDYIVNGEFQSEYGSGS